MQQHYDMIKGFGVSAVGFVAWAITHAEIDKMLGTATGFFALVLVMLTVCEKIHQWRIRNRKLRRFEAIRSSRANRSKVILPLLLVGMTLAAGCSSTPKTPPRPGETAATAGRQIATARESNAVARKAAAGVRDEVAKAQTTAEEIARLADRLIGKEPTP